MEYLGFNRNMATNV